MTFLNWTMLFALAAVAVPIVIHLLNRRTAVVVEWGAMRFLIASMASRKRRVMLEEIILMVLRALLVAVVALAMARPFLPTESSVPWAVVLPCVLGAAACGGVAAGGWSHARLRWAMLAAAGVLAALAAGTTALEHSTQMRLWSSRGDKDVVIVLDGSMSMSLARGKGSSFTQALDEARALIGECEAGDAIGILLAGPTPRAVTSGVISDRDRLADHLKKLKPTDGAMAPHAAIRAAAKMLEAGSHPRKWIVLITDGQNVGWGAKDEQAWQTTAMELAALAKGHDLPAPPRVICQMLPRVQQAMNLALADVQTSRRVVGTDRAVRIDVKVSNTAGEPGPPGEVKLAVDGQPAGAEAYPETGPGESATVAFHHTFAQPGVHTITASIDSKDALPGDNEAVRTLTVVEEIPVLIVDGSPAVGSSAGGVRFLAKALAPGAAQRKYLIRPEVVPDDRFEAASLSRYAVAILADVPELPAESSRALARWVEAGGGLLIAPGRAARPEFYNAWKTRTGEPVPAAKLQRRLSVADHPARLATSTFTHPALEILLDPQAEPDKVLVLSYWQMSPDVLADPPARVGGAMDSTDPLLVERRVGQGQVLQLAMALDNVDSTLYKPAHLPPLAHELVYYLSAPTAEEANVPPGARVAVRLRARAADKAAARKAPPAGPVEVIGPGDVRLEGTLECPAGQNAPVLVFGGAGEPGLYRFILPRGAGEDYLTAPGELAVPFAVTRDVAESHVEYLTKADFQVARKHIESFFPAQTRAEVAAALAGNVPGEELWKYLCLSGLALLLAELIFTRWVAARRTVHVVPEGSPAPAADAQGGPP